MSDMNTTNTELFRKALGESITAHYNNQILLCDGDVRLSRRHKAIMKRILSGDTAEVLNRSQVKKRTVIAILIAAVLLLSGCAYIYREEIREFFVEVFDDHYRTVSDHDKTCPEILETIYELSYVPEGYEFIKNYGDGRTNINYLWQKGNEKLSFTQMTLRTVSLIDGEGENVEIINYGRYVIYRVETSQYTDYYFWNDGVYSFDLLSTVKLPTAELFKIIDGIKTE